MNQGRKMSMTEMLVFLKAVMRCTLASYGGPEAHYGIFSSELVSKRKLLTEEELSELIGIFSLVPGPSSTQTITAIGYHLGGPLLAVLTVLTWTFPAILIMATFGLSFHFLKAYDVLNGGLYYLPAVAVGFICFAAIKMGLKVFKSKENVALYLLMIVLAFLTLHFSVWMVLVLLLSGGIITYFLNKERVKGGKALKLKPNWLLLSSLILLACLFEWLSSLGYQVLTLWASLYRYGYSVIGGGQVIIPLMIQDIVEGHQLISHSDFLSGYALDQAIPGPLFSFASFVAARSFASSSFGFIIGVIGGLLIFLPGTILVFVMTPLWQKLRQVTAFKAFLKGISTVVAALIAFTAIKQLLALPMGIDHLGVVFVTCLLLLNNKIPAPLIVLGMIILGLVVI